MFLFKTLSAIALTLIVLASHFTSNALNAQDTGSWVWDEHQCCWTPYGEPLKPAALAKEEKKEEKKEESKDCKCGPGCLCKHGDKSFCQCGPSCACQPKDEKPKECKCGPGCLCKHGDKSSCQCGPSCECKPKKPSEPAFLVPFSLGDCGWITWKPGLRIQVRYRWDDDNHEHDFFIRRFRLKCGGDAFEIAKYFGELKIDNTGRFHSNPRAEVENAWLDFTLCKRWSYLRAGLYDLPFSRDALTSDAKLLFMDRSLIKEELTFFGLADNTIGIMIHGRPYCGHLEYAFGIFDNVAFDRFGEHDDERRSKSLMPAARVVFNFFDPAEPPEGYADYWGSYLCEGHRLCWGFNGAYLGDIKDEELDDDDDFEIWAVGTDVFYNWCCFTFQAEFDWYKERARHGGEHVEGYGWYAQFGYMFWNCFEFATRYQELKPDLHDDDDREKEWTFGLNYYFREHNLKLQTEYSLFEEEHERISIFQVQLQLDF